MAKVKDRRYLLATRLWYTEAASLSSVDQRILATVAPYGGSSCLSRAADVPWMSLAERELDALAQRNWLLTGDF